MLNRKIMTSLKAWKSDSKRKSLILSGARQVGKTYIIREFCRREYASFVELNFLENEEFKLIFNGSLSADAILTGIRLYIPDIEIIPGETVVFLDEIQECPEAVTALKFLTIDERVDVIASGSALGISYKTRSSFPVGYVDFMDMYSLDFYEFIDAMNVGEDVIGVIRDCYESKNKVPAAIHEKLNTYLRQYLVVGGMPEVVDTFVATGDYKAVDTLQRQLYRSYLMDIARYAPPEDRVKAEKCYTSIPMQLNKENHKFQYSHVEKGGTARKFGSSLDWLVGSNMVIPVMNVTKPEYPLKSFAIDDNLRMYPNDIGFLIGTYGFEIKQALLGDAGIEAASQNIVLKTAKGGIYEALAAEMLYKKGIEQLYFYRNESGTLEIEFFIENMDGVVPVEIKAGRSRTRSLNTILESDDIRYGYKFASQNVGVTGKKITLPLYMLPLI